jgi:hypothetical protein
LGIDTWDIPGVIKVKTPREAVKKIKDITKKQKYCPQISQPPSLR